MFSGYQLKNDCVSWDKRMIMKEYKVEQVLKEMKEKKMKTCG